MDLIALIVACVPANVSADTIEAIIRTESAGNPYSIHVNKADIPFVEPRTAGEATAIADELIGQGFNVDLGLMQVNSANLARLQYSAADMFEPCTNIQAGAKILEYNYRWALNEGFSAGGPALRAALSAYNTGSLTGKTGQKYVSRVLRLAGVSVSLPADLPNPFTASSQVWSARAEEQPEPEEAAKLDDKPEPSDTTTE